VSAPDALLAAALLRDPAGPLLTFYDDATGERTELSATSLADWGAKTANLLRDDVGTAPGDRVAVLLPAHWQTAAVLLGAWSVGLVVSVRPWSTAGLAANDPVDVVFVSRERLGSWLEDVPEARHRFVLDLVPPEGKEVPDGYLDYVTEVRRYPDPAPEYDAVRPTDPASPDGTSFQEWAGLAHGIATSLGLKAGDRVLVNAGTAEQPVAWLLAPLMVGASVVLCANLDPDRAASEGVTHVL
jgi:uncharacterized protein (TIGR03089 family)